MRSSWSALSEALNRQYETLPKAIPLKSDKSVLGARGDKTAARWKKRGDPQTIELDETKGRIRWKSS